MIASARSIIRGVVILAGAASVLFADAPPAEKLPTDDALRAATATVKDTFKDDYKNATAKGKKDLESKLIAQAFDSKNSDVIQYALLLETSRVADSIGDVDMAVRVADELENRYPLTSVPRRFEILEGAARTASTPADCSELVNQYLALTDSAVWAGEFSIAAQSADRARNAAKRTETASIVERANSKYELAHELSIVQLRMKKAPDPTAVPGYAAVKCIIGGNSAEGLPLLAKSTDAQLAAIAKRDLLTPTTANDQVSLADAYAEFAKSKGHAPLDKFAALARSRYWYVKSMPALGGLEKLHAEKQLAASKGCVPESREERMAELKTALVSSTWGWYGPGVQMHFTDDGQCGHIGMHGTYEILGPRRVILHTSDTPSEYVFVFNEELTRYTAVGRGFGGERAQK